MDTFTCLGMAENRYCYGFFWHWLSRNLPVWCVQVLKSSRNAKNKSSNFCSYICMSTRRQTSFISVEFVMLIRSLFKSKVLSVICTLSLLNPRCNSQTMWICYVFTIASVVIHLARLTGSTEIKLGKHLQCT